MAEGGGEANESQIEEYIKHFVKEQTGKKIGVYIEYEDTQRSISIKTSKRTLELFELWKRVLHKKYPQDAYTYDEQDELILKVDEVKITVWEKGTLRIQGGDAKRWFLHNFKKILDNYVDRPDLK